VFAVTFGVVNVREPIAPEPVANATDVVPVTVPVPVIVPVPVAVIVSAVPDILAFIAMPPLVAVFITNPSVPVAVIVLLNVMLT
jgi:hypothetical protein